MAEEFDEEEVWAVIDDHNYKPKGRSPSAGKQPRKTSTPSKKCKGAIQYSAPLNIPGSSSCHHKKYSKGKDAQEEDEDDDNESFRNNASSEEEEEEEEDDQAMQEWITKKMKDSKISSTSTVYHGLRGRDLSKVRTDVLRRTGFIEKM